MVDGPPRLDPPVDGEVAIHQPGQTAQQALQLTRLVEGLHLHQQFVHDPAGSARVHEGTDGATLRGRGRSEAGHLATILGDGVDLLDEADGAALPPGGLAKLLEELADANVRHAEEHVLELRGGREQERNARLLGHRFGQVGLAGSGWALEEDAPPWVASQPLAERLVREEDVERAHDVVDLTVQSDDLVQSDLDLLRTDQSVGRATRHHRHDHHHGESAQDHHDQHLRHPVLPVGGQTGDRRIAVQNAPQ